MNPLFSDNCMIVRLFERVSVVTAACVAALLLVAPTASAQPVSVTAADPAVGEQETIALVVKVTGKNFAPGARADFFKSKTTDPAGIAVRETVYVSTTEVRATIDISPAAALSLFDIRVTNANGRSGKGSDLFQVVQQGSAKPATSVSASVTFRCYAQQETLEPDPCATPAGDDDYAVDRARDDGGAYAGGSIGSGVFNIHLMPSQSRPLTLMLGDLAGARTCLSVGNCNPDGPLNNTDLTLAEWYLRVKPLVTGTWEDMPGGLGAMTCGPTYPALVHYTFFLPNPDGHWGLNFNPRAYAPSTPLALTRLDSLTWTVESTASHLAELVSFAHSGIRRKNGPSIEGFFRVPFKLTITAGALPPGAMSCN
jgi:hypothetical protein